MPFLSIVRSAALVRRSEIQRFSLSTQKRRFLPNLQRRKFWLESENRWIRLRLTNAALRTIDKNGIEVVLAELRARGERI